MSYYIISFLNTAFLKRYFLNIFQNFNVTQKTKNGNYFTNIANSLQVCYAKT